MFTAPPETATYTRVIDFSRSRSGASRQVGVPQFYAKQMGDRNMVVAAWLMGWMVFLDYLAVTFIELCISLVLATTLYRWVFR